MPEPPPASLPCFPKASLVAFSAFNNRYAGRTCYVIGRGPTRFRFAELSRCPDPVFFINDAVCLEGHARGETFFFAHDARMRVWLDGAIRATAVLPLGGKMFLDQTDAVLNHAGSVVFYGWASSDPGPLLDLSRAELSARAELFRHSATIHSVLHFIWYCGFEEVGFIGCDGLNDPELLASVYQAPSGYDPRLANRSRTVPWWEYEGIRRIQDQLCTRLGLRSRYLGTPRPSGYEASRRFIVMAPRGGLQPLRPQHRPGAQGNQTESPPS